MFDLIACTVAMVCLVAILEKSLPTGVLGSLGLALIGCAALVAVDDSTFADVKRLEGIVSAVLVGFLLIVAHTVLMYWRSSTGALTPKRRATDWADLDAHEARGLE